jgi:NADH-quinone oxidoreductase subunit C
MENINTAAVVDSLKEKFADSIISSEMLDMMCITIEREKIIEVIEFLYHHPVYQFQFLTTMCGMHFPDAAQDKQLGMVYQVHSLINNLRLRIKFFFPDDSTIEIPTLTNLFSAANWMEREAYDFFGFKFKGHPDLRRILNMEDMVMFPMRKEFPLEDQTREDKDDTMFGR